MSAGELVPGNRRSCGFSFDAHLSPCATSAVSDVSASQAKPTDEQPASVYAKFETELQVRPDDIDMYRHVHSSRYMDYVLAARFDQMARCYKMPMSEFEKQGYGWFMAATQMNFRMALEMGDSFIVRTWIEKFTLIGLRVQFEIDRKSDGRRSCDGWFDYVMVSLQTARPVRIPENIRGKYSI